jgi:hypothetical protein
MTNQNFYVCGNKIVQITKTLLAKNYTGDLDGFYKLLRESKEGRSIRLMLLTVTANSLISVA